MGRTERVTRAAHCRSSDRFELQRHHLPVKWRKWLKRFHELNLSGAAVHSQFDAIDKASVIGRKECDRCGYFFRLAH